MKMIKKILSMILVISMLVGLSVSAFAKNDDNYGQNYEIDFVRVYVNGDYTPESVKVEVQRNKGTTRSVESSNVYENWSERNGRWKMYTDNNWKFNEVRSEDITVTLNGTKVDIIDIALETIIGKKITWGLDITVNAPVPKTYTVTWKNADGTILETDENVAAGTTPEYNGETPAKAADNKNTYTFKGWTPKVAPVTKDTTYTAEYTATKKTYNTTAEIKVFVDGEHEKNSVSVAYDTKYTSSDEDSAWKYQTDETYKGVTGHWELDLHGTDKWELPTELNENDFTVTIDGNEATVTSVENIFDKTRGDQEYELYIEVSYTKPVSTYTVTWKNGEDVLETDEDVAVGTMPEYNGETPTKAEDDTNTYEFAGWDPAITAVTGDAEYTATFTATEKKTIEDEETPLDPVPTAYPVYVYIKAPKDGDAAATEEFGQPNSYGYYYVGMKELTGIPENDVTKYHQKTGTNKLTYNDYESVLAPVVKELVPADILSRVTWGNFHVVVAKNDDESNSGLDTWHLDGVLKASEPEQTEPDPEPVDPPKSTIDIHVHIENNYKPGKLTLDYGAGKIVESQFSNNYDEVLKCWVEHDVNPDSLPALETDNFEVTLNGYTAFVSDVVKDEDGNAVCIHVDVPDVVYVYVCVVDENGNIIEEDAPNAEAAKDVVRPYFKNVNSTKKYYTLGSISVDGLPAPVYNDHNKGKLSDEELDAQFEAYADLLIPGLEEKIDLYKSNWAEGADDAKIKEMMKDVTWNVLHVDNGANDYNLGTVNGKIKPAVWHLDGYLTLKTEETEPTTPPTEEPTTPPTDEPTTPPTDEPTTPPTDEPTTPPTDEPTTPPTDEPTTPPTDEPTTPPTDEPTTPPTNEDNNNNNNNNDGGDYYPPTPDTPVGGGDDETIVDEDVPLGGEPEGEETIEDEDVPLGDMPEEELEEIEDDEVPLDATPKTGNALRMIRNIAFAIAALSFSGLMASVVITKKKFDF